MKLWNLLLKTRTFWLLVGGVISFVLLNGVNMLTNLRNMPSETEKTYHKLQSWYYNDTKWTGTWSSREEGNLNRMLKKSEALEKPMSTRPKMAENYLVKLLFGLILTCLVDSGT